MNAARRLENGAIQMALPLEKKKSRRSFTRMPQWHLEINERFKYRRLELGETQEEFARRLQTTESMVKQIETGRVNVNLHLIKQLRQTGVSYAWIFGEALLQ